MTLLIDRQVLLWFLEDNPRLIPANKVMLEDPENTIWGSQISLLELAIKLKTGKLPDFVVSIPAVAEQIRLDGFGVMALSTEHIIA